MPNLRPAQNFQVIFSLTSVSVILSMAISKDSKRSDLFNLLAN
jgi:hypothetical protein